MLTADPADPESMEAAEAKFGGSLRKGLPCNAAGVQAVLANTGELFLLAAQDCVLANNVPLCQLGVGSWLDGKGLTEFMGKAKGGKTIIIIWPTPTTPTHPPSHMHPPAGAPGESYVDFEAKSDEDSFAFVMKPEMTSAKFPTVPMPLYAFLSFLEGQHVLNTRLVNHSEITRIAKSSAEGRVTFELSRTAETKWKPQTSAKDVEGFWGLLLDLAKVYESTTLRVVLKLEYYSSQNLLVPECPYVYLTHSLRLHANKLVRIL